MGRQMLSVQAKLNLYIPRDINYIHDYWIISQKQFYFLFFDPFELCVWRNLTTLFTSIGIW